MAAIAGREGPARADREHLRARKRARIGDRAPRECARGQAKSQGSNQREANERKRQPRTLEARLGLEGERGRQHVRRPRDHLAVDDGRLQLVVPADFLPQERLDLAVANREAKDRMGDGVIGVGRDGDRARQRGERDEGRIARREVL